MRRSGGSTSSSNNAGMGPRMPSHEVTEALFDSVVNLNFKGPFRLASQVAKRMADGDGGCIINVSSTGALMPLPEVIPYGSSKAALNAMSRQPGKGICAPRCGSTRSRPGRS